MDKKLLEDQDNTFDRVLDRLKLEQIDTYLFRYKGKNAGLLRIFGGQVIAQSFIAANHTVADDTHLHSCLLYTSPSPRDATLSRMPSSA